MGIQSPYLPAEDEGINITEQMFFIGVDLGQANDYTAISIIERQIKAPGVLGYDRRGERMLYLRHIERMRGMEYPAIVDRIIQIYHSEALKGVHKAVVIDYTGLGRPVFDMMRQAGFRYSLSAISITGGINANYTDRHWNVPKRELVSRLQIELQNNRLKFANGMKEANTLVEELANFQTKITDDGHDTYNGASGIHDDIVMSVSMAVWLACRPYLHNWGNDAAM